MWHKQGAPLPCRWQEEEMPDYSEFDAMLQRGSGGELGPGYSQSRALMKAKSRVKISDLPDELAPTQVRVSTVTSGRMTAGPRSAVGYSSACGGRKWSGASNWPNAGGSSWSHDAGRLRATTSALVWIGRGMP